MTAGMMAAPLKRDAGSPRPHDPARPPLTAVLTALLLHLCCLALFGLLPQDKPIEPLGDVIAVSLVVLPDRGGRSSAGAWSGARFAPSDNAPAAAIAQERHARPAAAKPPRDRTATEARVTSQPRDELATAITPATKAPAVVGTDSTAAKGLIPASNQAGTVAESATGSIDSATGSGQALPLPAAPRLLQGGRPRYPDIARRRGLEGTVLLQVLVLDDGRVGEASIRRSSTHRLLDAAALDAIRDWRFAPGSQNGKPAAMAVEIPVIFRLTNG